MPVMDGLEATRLIRSFEKTGNWDEAKKAGVEPHNSILNHQTLDEPRKRIPIIAVSKVNLDMLTTKNGSICITAVSYLEWFTFFCTSKLGNLLNAKPHALLLLLYNI